MRILCWNTNGLYNTLKDASIRYTSTSKYFSDILAADIICVQECKIQEEKLEKWMACVPGYESFWAFSSKKKGYSGVVTYVKEELSPLAASADYLGDFDDPHMEELCREGRLVETEHGSFTLINVYVPNAGDRSEGRLRLGFKLKFLEALKRRCDELVCSGKHVVIVGDFNIPHREIDVFKEWNIKDIYSSEELAWIDAFFMEYVDLFRHFHPDARDIFSVWDQKTEARIHNEGVRIDYAVCNRGFLSQILDTQIIKMVPKQWSDHAAVVLTLKDQPVLPMHQIPALSSRNMKRFQEEQRQKKITSIFTCASNALITKKTKNSSVLSNAASDTSDVAPSKVDTCANAGNIITKIGHDSGDNPCSMTREGVNFHDSVTSRHSDSSCHLGQEDSDTRLPNSDHISSSFVNQSPERGQHSITPSTSPLSEAEGEQRTSGKREAPSIISKTDDTALTSELQCTKKRTGKKQEAEFKPISMSNKKNNDPRRVSSLQGDGSESKLQKESSSRTQATQNKQRSLTLYFSKG